MSQPILLRGAKQVLTLRGTPGVRRGPDFSKLEVIEDGSVFIQDGKIASVGSTRRMENLKEVKGALNIPVHNCVVMPGFVDPAIQLSLSAPDKLGVLKRRKLSDFFNDSITLMRQCLIHGTLHAAVRAGSGVSSLGADLSVLRQLARIGNSPVGMTRIWRPAIDDAHAPNPQALADMLRTILRQKLADSVELSGNPDRSSNSVLAAAAGTAAMMMGLEWDGGSPSHLGSALQQSSAAGVFCRHQISAEECDELIHARSTAIFQAGCELLDRPPVSSLAGLVEAGGGLALGSGYDALYEPNYNMQFVLALAVMRLRLTIEQAIVASTINAAYAVNVGHQVGSIEPGKRADVIVLNLNDYREIPRRLGVNHVAMAIRDGNLAINRTRWRVGAA